MEFLVQNRISQMVIKQLTTKNDVFYDNFFTLYKEKEQIARPKSDHVTRKFGGRFPWARALCLI
jgi:hypothetical protein